jgi:hypothetical protein
MKCPLSITQISRLILVCITLGTILNKDANGQARAELPEPKAPIPKESYKSWSLFLINNPKWLLAESGDNLKKLYDQFQAFGQAIGPDHLAVWFWSDEHTKAVDVDRSAAICSKLKLAPSKGPYILVTTEYPGACIVGSPDTFPANLDRFQIRLELNKATASEITSLLTGVADQLIAGDLGKLSVNSEDYWRAWRQSFEAVRGTLVGLSQAFTVTFKTPFFDVQLKP